MYETNEIFDMTLSSPTGGAVLDYPPTLRGYILDDETQSKISITDTPVTEGNSGTTYAHVPVTINPPAGFPVTVTFVVGSGESATAGEDYKPFSGSLTFQPGEGTKTIDVPIVGDTNYELNEVFGVSLVAATPAQDVLITNYGAHVTIVNDDIGKVLCTPSVSVPEGPSGSSSFVEITCTPDSPFAGGVHYITANGTAGFDDYTFSSGSIVFNPGIYFGQQKFTVPIVGDDTIEPNEQFTINLRAEPAEGWNFIVEPAVITVTILNDDTPGVVRCTDGFATEGNGGSKDVTITCTSPTKIAGTIDYATADGTATAADYGKVSGTLTFEDEAVKSFTVPIFGDKEVEPDEQFTVHFTAHPSTRLPFSLDRDTAVVTIMNDDEPPPRGNLVLAPPHVVVTVGDTAQVRAMIEPPFGDPVTLAIVTQDPSIADVPSAVIVAPHQPAFITITAKKRGTTAATVAGGDLVAVLFIEVTEGPPSLKSVSPASGPTLGGAVALHGANLSSGCTAWFGGVQASSVVANATTATVAAPPHEVGNVDVALTCGSATVTLPQAFTYVPVRGRAARH
jgi:hypothetical protein